MKPIPTFMHGVADYLFGFLFFFSPQLFGFAEAGGIVVLLPRILGAIMIVQAFLTDYELGVVKVIPMRAHLTSDMALGALTAVSPWLFGFSEYYPATTTFVIFGIIEIVAATLTRISPVEYRGAQ